MNPGSGTNQKEIARALSAIGKALSVYTLYGFNHPLSEQTVETTYRDFCRFFDNCALLNIGTVAGRLVVEGLPLEESNSLIKGLERKFIALGITNLTLRSGLTLTDYTRLVELLHQADRAELDQAIRSSEIGNVSSEEDMEYHLIHKGEHPESWESGGDPSGNAPEAEEPAASEEEKPAAPPEPAINIEQIVAYLKGESESGNPHVDAEVAKLASDPEKLGQLILESVVMRQAVSSLSETESLADVVLGCLRKTFDDLKHIDAFQKRSGKASMKKAMAVLEKSILDRLQKITGQPDPERDKKIHNAIKNMKMDIDMEGVLEKYTAQSDALQQSQNKIIRYVEKRGVEDAKNLLHADEIPDREWRKITVEGTRKRHKINTVSAGDTGALLTETLSSLASMMEKLETMMPKDNRRDELGEILEQVEKDVAGVAARTQKKITDLGKKISEEETDETTVGGAAQKMSKAQLLGDIAEITQELAQPLTAIDAIIEMILTGFVGNVPEEQRDLLKLAAGSGDHLGYLLEQLKDIVGMPKELGTQTRFHHDLGLHKDILL